MGAEMSTPSVPGALSPKCSQRPGSWGNQSVPRGLVVQHRSHGLVGGTDIIGTLGSVILQALVTTACWGWDGITSLEVGPMSLDYFHYSASRGGGHYRVCVKGVARGLATQVPRHCWFPSTHGQVHTAQTCTWHLHRTGLLSKPDSSLFRLLGNGWRSPQPSAGQPQLWPLLFCSPEVALL